MAKGQDGQPVAQGGQGQAGERRHRPSIYEGMDEGDSES